jgi:hypothetical protein
VLLSGGRDRLQRRIQICMLCTLGVLMGVGVIVIGNKALTLINATAAAMPSSAMWLSAAP